MNWQILFGRQWYLTPPISVQELNIVWSLWSQVTVLTEPGVLSTSLGGASMRFRSYIRRTFSTPPVSKNCASCLKLAKKCENFIQDKHPFYDKKGAKVLTVFINWDVPLKKNRLAQCVCAQKSAVHPQI